MQHYTMSPTDFVTYSHKKGSPLNIYTSRLLTVWDVECEKDRTWFLKMRCSMFRAGLTIWSPTAAAFFCTNRKHVSQQKPSQEYFAWHWTSNNGHKKTNNSQQHLTRGMCIQQCCYPSDYLILSHTISTLLQNIHSTIKIQQNIWLFNTINNVLHAFFFCTDNFLYNNGITDKWVEYMSIWMETKVLITFA
jgi:hypothetical protein